MPLSPNPRPAFLFDLDGTLVDWSAAATSWLRRHYEQQGLQFIDFTRYLERFLSLATGGYADKNRLFETLVAEFSLPVSAAEMLADYRAKLWRYCRSFPGASEVLSELRHRGSKLAIVTNGTLENQGNKIRALRFDALVDATVISEQEGCKKPDPQIFLAAAARLGVPPAECVFVGDHTERDVVGAANAGMRTVWVRRSDSASWELPTRPDWVIGSLIELLEIPV